MPDLPERLREAARMTDLFDGLMSRVTIEDQPELERALKEWASSDEMQLDLEHAAYEIESLRSKNERLQKRMEYNWNANDEAFPLRLRVAKLEEALEPFADLDIPGGAIDDMHRYLIADREIRRAAEALVNE